MNTSLRTLALAAAAGLAMASAGAATVTIPQSALNASPGVYTPGGYYTDALGANIVTTGGGSAANVGQADGRNDDGFMQLNLGFDFSFFGTTYNSLYINNNGNVSFGGGISAYVPSGPTGANAPVISPYFGDVDTRGENSGVVHYKLSANELVVTWDNVGRFAGRDDLLNSFQLVLRSDAFAVPVGEGKIGFFYEQMLWEVTDTSQVAAVGFGDGQGNAEVLQGSTQAGLFRALNNKYIWFDANLDVVDPNDVPEPTTLALALAALGAAGFSARRRKS
ncbi:MULTISPECIES: nidogen-like domain-containing protein [Rubrivivax]|uniref:PEP-CTERM sorting domain-containing protein n=1 Tax=Rubrivivax benzoatilyticus TaxID=316997 RepID=A0ABX0I3A9_9BURK|nr:MULTISPECIES: nidogen-like domain-containing protein [Rubrivivax]MCC9596506.1 PEP-CTERM sorting domain-containing protein [Rubrivivax sp. JA1055]MCC9648661.1 PEP-CTERM sorting domain-containing protein [Rubrivivax sp. JA1029]NHL00075.1 PEP-CTERM sorting domain-containing protein [Rubrivivax benzoatilyticus]NHL25909.1 PEP-CTERM sorting domain-containing protein [Rubrivivax benzoatilyticus]